MAREAVIRLVAPLSELEQLYKNAQAAERAERNAERVVSEARTRLEAAEREAERARATATQAWETHLARKREAASPAIIAQAQRTSSAAQG